MTKANANAGQGMPAAWYAGPHKDALIYLMVAIFLVELVVGGVAFFYGLVHARPELPGGPPLARFPWLGWAVAAVLAPVGLLLLLHLCGTWVARFLGKEANGHTGAPDSAEAAQVPPRVRQFYAVVRSAPTVVVLLGVMLLGASLLFVDGALSSLLRLGRDLLPYMPWLAGSLAGMLAACYLTHRWFLYRHHRLQQEYAFRREVLERTGIVLVDKGCVPLARTDEDRLALNSVVETQALPVSPDILPQAPGHEPPAGNGTRDPAAVTDVTPPTTTSQGELP